MFRTPSDDLPYGAAAGGGYNKRAIMDTLHFTYGGAPGGGMRFEPHEVSSEVKMQGDLPKGWNDNPPPERWAGLNTGRADVVHHDVRVSRVEATWLLNKLQREDSEESDIDSQIRFSLWRKFGGNP